MLDFAVFDYLLDSVFIVNADGKVVYCNELAATFSQSSVKRLSSGKTAFHEVINFAEPGLVPFTKDSKGFDAPSPLIETAYTFVKDGRTGKTQLTVRPIGDGQHWIFFLHDVSLEETLAAKYKAELQKTEEYARNLEKLVEARTAELRKVNQTLNAILDSLGQGFFTFSAEGVCGEVFTKACKEILEKLPKGLKARDVLGVPAADSQQFAKWTESLFKEYLPFDDLKGLGPNLYPHSEKKHIVLDYYPIRQGKEISDVVVVATDKTAEREAQIALEAERQYASMVVKYMKNKDLFNQFLHSVKAACDRLGAMALKSMSAEETSESFRILHTIEGEAGTFSVREIQMAARESQHVLEPFKSGSVMGDWDRELYANSIISLQSSFEDFLAHNSGIIQLPKETGRTIEISVAAIKSIISDLESLPGGSALAKRCQDLCLKEPIESRLKYFEGLTQTVAERLGKRVHPLKITGGEVRVHPETLNKFFSSLVHAFRNAVDHGLEQPEDREWGGKDAAGTISISIEESNGTLKMDIADDGRGIDPALIREKLKTKFPDRDFSTQSDQEVIQQVCMPGFSSRDSVGEFSGRGVGLDALREEVLSLGGTIYIKSKVGQGTTLEIRIPLDPAGGQLLRSA